MNKFALGFVLAIIASSASAHMSADKSAEDCLAGNWHNCDRLIAAMGSRSGSQRTGIPYNIEAAIEVGKRGCQVGQLDVCYRYAQILYKSESGRYVNRAGATGLWKQMCQRNHKKSCDALDRHGLR